MRRSSTTIAGLVALVALACSDAPSDETPKGAVRLFLSAMERTAWDPDARRDAYVLLSESDREVLAERAHRASSLGGRVIEPWEMIVEGRYRARFAPGAAGLRERIDGERARVTVANQEGTRRAEIPLVREDGRWRIVLAIPAAEVTAER